MTSISLLPLAIATPTAGAPDAPPGVSGDAAPAFALPLFAIVAPADRQSPSAPGIALPELAVVRRGEDRRIVLPRGDGFGVEEVALSPVAYPGEGRASVATLAEPKPNPRHRAVLPADPGLRRGTAKDAAADLPSKAGPENSASATAIPAIRDEPVTPAGPIDVTGSPSPRDPPAPRSASPKAGGDIADPQPGQFPAGPAPRTAIPRAPGREAATPGAATRLDTSRSAIGRDPVPVSVSGAQEAGAAPPAPVDRGSRDHPVVATPSAEAPTIVASPRLASIDRPVRSLRESAPIIDRAAINPGVVLQTREWPAGIDPAARRALPGAIADPIARIPARFSPADRPVSRLANADRTETPVAIAPVAPREREAPPQRPSPQIVQRFALTTPTGVIDAVTMPPRLVSPQTCAVPARFTVAEYAPAPPAAVGTATSVTAPAASPPAIEGAAASIPIVAARPDPTPLKVVETRTHPNADRPAATATAPAPTVVTRAPAPVSAPVSLAAVPVEAPRTATVRLAVRSASPVAAPNAATLASLPLDTPVPQPLVPAAAIPAGADLQRGPLDLTRADWPATMIDRIERLRDDANAADTSIRLIPDALGAIEVSLHQDGEATHVHFTADQPQTRTILAEAQPRLAELAEARGLKLGQTGVGGGEAGTHTGAGQQQRQQPQSFVPCAPLRDPRQTTNDHRIA